MDPQPRLAERITAPDMAEASPAEAKRRRDALFVETVAIEAGARTTSLNEFERLTPEQHEEVLRNALAWREVLARSIERYLSLIDDLERRAGGSDPERGRA
jgi:hypothetical protein